MKDTHVIAAACSLALIAIVGVFIGYATDTLPKHKQRVITSSAPSSAPQKKCVCCVEKIKFIRKHMETEIKKEADVGDIWT